MTTWLFNHPVVALAMLWLPIASGVALFINVMLLVDDGGVEYLDDDWDADFPIVPPELVVLDGGLRLFDFERNDPAIPSGDVA